MNRSFPLTAVHLVKLSKNLGFPLAENNAGWKYILDKFPDVKYIALAESGHHRPKQLADGTFKLSFASAGCCRAQAEVLLWPKTDLINTAGNCSHFLGFGSHALLRPAAPQKPFDQIERNRLPQRCRPSCSGANAIHRTGLFDEIFFAYLGRRRSGMETPPARLPHRICPIGGRHNGINILSSNNGRFIIISSETAGIC